MSLNAEAEVVRQRLSVLELAESLGNVSEACRQRDMSRTQFYEYKRRFQTHGLEGLKDLPPIHHSHPATTAPEVEARLLALSLEHPAWGCDRLSDHVALEGINVSGVTVQRILNDHDMGTRYHRWLKLEEQRGGTAVELTAEQVKFIEKQNPAFRERHVESGQPGELLCQDSFQVGHIEGIGRVYLHVVVDTYGSSAFGFLHTTKRPEAAVAVLHNDVLPFYQAHNIPVGAVLTDNGREFCGTESHPYELYLALNEMEHRRTKVRKPQTNGFVERFNRTVLDEFFRIAFRTRFYESVEQLQADLDEWLAYYNYERPHQGYRNTPAPAPQVLVWAAGPSIPSTSSWKKKVRLSTSTLLLYGTMPKSTQLARVYEADTPEGRQERTEGAVTITQGTSLDAGATVHELDSNTPLDFRLYWAIGDDLLFILDQDRKPKVGTASWSYVLNRTQWHIETTRWRPTAR